MAWIKTIPWSAANKQLRDAIKKQKKLYPTEYGIPDHALDQINESIVNSHSLIPDALYHALFILHMPIHALLDAYTST